jgi:hypothetical protein
LVIQNRSKILRGVCFALPLVKLNRFQQMFSKEKTDVLAFLDAYLDETSTESIEQDIAAISQMDFAGSSAADYFDNFHQYYEGKNSDIAESLFPDVANEDITLMETGLAA